MQSDDPGEPAAPLDATGANLISMQPQQSGQHQRQQVAYSTSPVQGQQHASVYPGAHHTETAHQTVAQT